MKVLLVVPPYRTTDRLVAQLYPMPLGPVLLGTVLRGLGHRVTLVDFLLSAEAHKCAAPESFAGLGAPPYRHYGMPLEECKAWLAANVEPFDAVGLAMGPCNVYETGAELGRQIKHLGLPLVVGGPFVTTATEEAMALSGADVGVVGEGESVVEEAFGLAASGGSGIVRGEPMDLGDVPIPDWSLAPLGGYPKFKGRVRGVLTVSRGCPHACRFCSVHTVAGRRHRRQDADRIRAEIVNLWEAGARYLCFLDDNLFMTEKATATLLGVLGELRSSVPGFGRARFYVEEGMEVRLAARPGVVAAIAEAGFENIALGLETMDAGRRAELRKPYKAGDLMAAVENCRAAGVRAKAFYVIGFPGDTVESVCRDLVEFGRLGLAARPNNLKLYPGTAITAQYLGAGWIGPDYDWRLCSWYTPPSGGVSYREIKRLKTVIGAIGHAADKFGIALFGDSREKIAAAMAAKKYLLEAGAGGGLVVRGNMYRATPYRRMAELLLLREGALGARSVVGDKIVTVERLDAPADAVQAGFVAALGDVALAAAIPASSVVPDNGPEGKIQGTSIFDPVLCEALYRWFCPPGGVVLDPFAGGSVRGIVAAALGRDYVGVDLRVGQVAANRDQAAEVLGRQSGPYLPAVLDPAALTPVVEAGDIWVKRDDLFEVPGARVWGGKARGAWRLCQGALGVATSGPKHSPQIVIVARIAEMLGIPCRVHVPSGKWEPELYAAERAGAEVVQHKPGRNSVLRKRARDDAMARGWRLVPFAMECEEYVIATAEQVANLPDDFGRLVVPVGSGMSLAGILRGVMARGLRRPVVGVRVGADPRPFLAKWAPLGWEDWVTIVDSPLPYDEPLDGATLADGTPLDSGYEAKAAAFLEPGDVFWMVGLRPTEAENPLGSVGRASWVVGDARDVAALAPGPFDFVLTCPPYFDLEQYSDDPADLSNAPDYAAFLADLRGIVAASVGLLREDRFACFVVSNIREPGGYYRHLVADTVEAFEDAGARFYNDAVLVTATGTLPIRAGRQMQAGRKLGRAHQNVLVFCKGSWRKAAQAVGPVDASGGVPA